MLVEGLMISRENRFGRPLLHAGKSCMLATDCLLDVGSNSLDRSGAFAANALILLARKLSVPVVLSIFCSDGAAVDDAGLLLRPDHGLHVDRHQSFDPWHGPTLSDRVRSWERPTIIIFGRCAEALLTMAALGALERGFDTFLAVDAVAWASGQYEGIHRARLEQAGVVPVSTKQVVIELFGSSGIDDHVAEAIEFLHAHGLG